MKYQIEHFSEIADNPQDKLTELFAFALENEVPNTRFVLDTGAFFKLWAGRDPVGKALVITARDEQGKLTGLVMAGAINNPLFIKRPFVFRFVDVTKQDKAFEDYINVVLGSL